MGSAKLIIAVFSNDSEFTKSVSGSEYALNRGKNRAINSRLFSSTSNAHTLGDVDLIIYDVDIAKNDLLRVTEDVLRLKLHSPTSPLLLVGNEHAIVEAMESERVTTSICKAIAKPVQANELRSEIDGEIAKSLPFSANKKQPNKSLFKRASITLGGLLSAVLLLISTPAQAQTQYAYLKEAQVSLPATAEIQRLEKLSLLNDKAADALEQGKIVHPANGNALHYYDQILAIDVYHSEAYRGRQKIVTELRTSIPELIKARKFAQARKAIQVLYKAEPFSDNNRQLVIALHKAGGSFRASKTASY